MKARGKEAPLLHEGGKKFEYYAFISYKHLDKPWARWAQRQLEHYRLPNRLCRQRDLPKHVSPVFRDETDLTGGKTVYALLDEKICQSKYLIVICSKNMQVNPQYIDYEIENFLAAGNPPSRILPLIVDGMANAADPAMECLPPALKRMAKDMPLGITVNRKNRKEAILKLVACILELDLQALRSHNQARNQRRIMAALSGGMAFSLALGAFMAWEVLSVKQASLREQLTYASDTFRQGDRLSAGASAAGVAEEYNALMAQDIRVDAERLSVLTAIHPKYQPLTRLCDASGDSRLMFDSTGQHVLVRTSNGVRKYDMQGREVMAFEISQTDQQIVGVSADGVHAVVMSIYQRNLAGTHLWLWNMEEDRLVCYLMGSEVYSQENERVGNFTTPVTAVFSPDGKTVCAYCPKDGGYANGNANSELAAWDVATGEKICSLPSTLMGTNRLVKKFEFIGSTTLHWEGETNHVYYTLGDAEPVVLSVRALPSASSIKKSLARGDLLRIVGGKRYTLSAEKQGSSYLLKNRLTQDGLSITSAQAEYDYMLFLSGEDAQEELLLVDLNRMEAVEDSEDRSRVIGGIRPESSAPSAEEQGSPYLIKDLVTGSTLPIQVGGGRSCAVMEYASRYLLFLIGQTDELGLLRLEEVRLADLHTMQELACAQDFTRAISGLRLTEWPEESSRSVVYLRDDNGDLHRLDLATGEYLAVRGAAGYQLVGYTETMDVLVAAGTELLHILEIEGNSSRDYALEADYAEFARSAVFSPAGAYMAARHNGGYYLYPLQHPGQQLDAGLAFTGKSQEACSPDGQLVIRGGGNALAIWRAGEMLLHTQLEQEICCVGATNGRVLAVTEDALLLYDEKGALLGRLQAEGYDRFHAAKITADGRRIALVKGSESAFADNAYTLMLLDGDTLTPVATVTDRMHKSPGGAFESVYDLSPDGRWLSAVLRISSDEESPFQLSAAVWDAADGRLHAMTETPLVDEVPEFSMFSFSNGLTSAFRLQYVKFASNGHLLSGLQYGSWVFDVENISTVTYMQEGAGADALPEMLADGQFLYPDEGVRVWDATNGSLKTVLAHQVAMSDVNSMLKDGNQHRLYISGDQQWAVITGAHGTWLYNTQDWKSNAMLASQSARVLHLDDHLLIYVTADGLWRLAY